MTLSPPVRVFALLGVLAAVGLAGFFVLAGRSEPETFTKPTTPARTTTTPSRTPQATARPRTTPQNRPAEALPASGFPLPIHRALERNRVVVVMVYMPGASVDAVVRAEAKAGARAARAGFVPVSALSERLVRPLVAKTGVLPDPAVVVLKRPGVVTATLSVTDRDTVAQAVTQARR